MEKHKSKPDTLSTVMWRYISEAAVFFQKSDKPH